MIENEKLAALQKQRRVRKILQQNPFLGRYLQKCSPEHKLVLLSLLSIGQEAVLSHASQRSIRKLQLLAEKLSLVERFYQADGGLIGYHLRARDLIRKLPVSGGAAVFKPPLIDIREKTAEVIQKNALALENLSEMAMILPMGGAGDRLGLTDRKTGEPLPAALLPFLGKSLLELLIIDIQALEHLYFKTYGRQLILPIVIMTSEEKNNQTHILKMLEKHNYFSRPKERFFLFSQISVPVVAEKGDWLISDYLTPLLKPGGHGVLWQLMEEKGAFDWLLALGAKKALVRQINNPLAGTDYSLLAFMGYGLSSGKALGFASCSRRVGAAEGINVLRREKQKSGYAYALTNIEYTDFAKWQIRDAPMTPESLYSEFPSNTNILFIDLKAVRRKARRGIFPGRIINFKSKFACVDRSGRQKELCGGRIELMMQNIADYFTSPKKELKAFATYNHRHKTISVTKRAFLPGGDIKETPECCFYDMLCNYHELLSGLCKMILPPMPDLEEYVRSGPSFICLMHPGAGPLYRDIAAKIQGGHLSVGSELQLEIADFSLLNLQLQGSLLVRAKCITGKTDLPRGIYYSEQKGRCYLENVQVQNAGGEFNDISKLWQNKIRRQEALTIILEGNSLFAAKDVVFKGACRITVPDNTKVTAFMACGKVKLKREAL